MTPVHGVSLNHFFSFHITLTLEVHSLTTVTLCALEWEYIYMPYLEFNHQYMTALMLLTAYMTALMTAFHTHIG